MREHCKAEGCLVIPVKGEYCASHANTCVDCGIRIPRKLSRCYKHKKLMTSPIRGMQKEPTNLGGRIEQLEQILADYQEDIAKGANRIVQADIEYIRGRIQLERGLSAAV